jgi:IS5 family transposase
MTNNPTPQAREAIPYQPALRPEMPVIYGPIEFRDFRDRFIEIDRLLDQGGLEADFIISVSLERSAELDVASADVRQQFVRFTGLALRCNLARSILGLTLRDFAIRAAESSVLQWFLRLGEVDRIKAPSKSNVERFSKWVNEDTMRRFHQKLIDKATTPATAQAPQPLNLPEALDASEAFFDSTCLKATIHFPVDWILLRDATRTLMKATVLIRAQCLKQRMPQEPLAFLSEMNKLAMAMSANRGKPESKKRRKQTLRAMKALQKKVTKHAESHRDLLQARWAETELSEKQAQVIIERINNVLTQLPAAIAQAHERIIGERKVPNGEKILSLYEQEVEVLKRGKAGAEVEFGNKLWLAELKSGLIVDWDLRKEAEADTALVLPSVKRIVEDLKLDLGKVWGDRGLASQENNAQLQKLEIVSGLCPRNPIELKRRLQDEDGFREGMKRRGGIEPRIAIFKRLFVGSPCTAKGFAARKLAVSWAVMAHNLWVLARLKLAQKQEAEKLEAA